ncbi:transcription factor Ovo-like 2 [Aphis craccivora]|uniref:Transcription factor Ovo-like 2 n=1 Tax=Aphis craccivora TaxID=307492 RepID=A0A6G0YB55_APHCR|nr:transcription factor Ovo-like 2 [Aphis craccivora]
MFKCAVCGKVCVYKRDLNRHAKIHDGSKNMCRICRKTFTRRNALSIHVQNCHKIAKNTPEFENAVQITDAIDK